MLAKTGVRELLGAHQGNWDGRAALSPRTQNLWRIPQIPNLSLEVGSQCRSWFPVPTRVKAPCVFVCPDRGWSSGTLEQDLAQSRHTVNLRQFVDECLTSCSEMPYFQKSLLFSICALKTLVRSVYYVFESLSEYGQENVQSRRGTNKKPRALRKHFKDIMKYTFQLKDICGRMSAFPKAVRILAPGTWIC